MLERQVLHPAREVASAQACLSAQAVLGIKWDRDALEPFFTREEDGFGVGEEKEVFVNTVDDLRGYSTVSNTAWKSSRRLRNAHPS